MAALARVSVLRCCEGTVYRCAVLFEDYSALLLIAHAGGALLCVALTTHLFVWLRKRRGHRSRRRFALWAAGSYLLTMALGMALYPTYKVRVRAEFLENPSAISRATEDEAEAGSLAKARNTESRLFRLGQAAAITPPAEPTPEEREAVAARAEKRIERGAKLSRWFDVKEHWSVLGMLLSAGLVLILWPRGSEKPRDEVHRSAVALALLATIFAWLAAIIGVVVTAARSVAPL